VPFGNREMTPEHVLAYPALPESWEDLVLLMDKEEGMTSFDIIRRLRRISPVRKIGHAGTLDPMATGLVICLSGRATKRMTTFMDMQKVYTGTIRLGETTASFDRETPVDVVRPTGDISPERLEEVSHQFVGDITQTTPVYSAVKVGGERLYRKARRGERVTLPTRDVHISEFELGAPDGADVSFRVTCSKGTYIRSLASEFGEALGCGGHLTALRRVQIGDYHVDNAWPVSALLEQMS